MARVCMRGRCSVITNSPPSKSSPGSVQQDRDLHRKDMLAVEVAVQAVVVLRRRTPAAAASDESGRPGGSDRGRPRGRAGSAPSLAHALVPAVGDRRQVGIGGRPQRLDQGRQRVAEVLVLAPTEAVPGHDDVAAEASS